MKTLPLMQKAAQFKLAMREFGRLEGVDDDPARTHTIADLVFITQFEIDLAESGESEIDVLPHRKFVKKWGKFSEDKDYSQSQEIADNDGRVWK